MKYFFLIIFLGISLIGMAQIQKGVYIAEVIQEDLTTVHEIKIDNSYLVYTVYTMNPANFVSTVGGFYTLEKNKLSLALEFNSNYNVDGLKAKQWPVEVSDSTIIMHVAQPLVFKKLPTLHQELDGKWLFATRGPDEGQERRGEEQARKTMKFLIDGHFQWIAYQTETFKFSGSGGGMFTSKDGNYQEQISFFSRDNDRVGANLDFTFTIKDSDWHHTGLNSKGEPMYEIWSLRE